MSTVTDRPTRRAWVLWFDQPFLHGSYESCMTQDIWAAELDRVCGFRSIGGFWRMYNNVSEPSQLRYGSAYYMFREGAVPPCMYITETGTSVHIVFNREGPAALCETDTDVDAAWLLAALLAIGNRSKKVAEVYGAAVKCHKHRHEVVVYLGNDHIKNGRFARRMIKLMRARAICPVAMYRQAYVDGAMVKEVTYELGQKK